ncbi:MAG: GGDEF domain-containing protein [Desulfarculaceae bacterium]|nr:GGDEF domain-containing protein [Desulfarculaceae bacterium]
MPPALLADPNQALRLKRNLYALAAGAVYTLLCWVLWKWNFFRATPNEFFLLFGSFWLVNICWPIMIISGFNLRFRDPSLTLGQIAWATITVMVSLYFVYQLRMAVLMYYLLVMIFGAFHLRLSGFLSISGMAILGYGLVIFFLNRNHSEILNLRVEYVQWLTFSVVLSCFSLMGTSLSALRRRYLRQNRQLGGALERIRELAITDELTGVWNRRRGMQALDGHLALAQRGGYEFAVCYMDLDHFKKVNDRYGHHAGDVVLQAAAKAMAGELREVDNFSRFGGEEFVAVLVQAGQDRALMVAERLRRRVRGLDFSLVAPGLRVTVSVGVAAYQPGESVDQLLRRADQAHYQAKTLGRDQVVAAPPSA